MWSTRRPRGFFTNLDRTRRVGLEAAASATPLRGVSALRLSGSVAWTRATFESPAELASPLLEPDTTATGADDGPVVVEPGDRFPMVPELSASLGATYRVGSVTLGAEASWTGSQYLVGDEGNDEELPRLDAFTVVDLSLQWDAGPTTVFAELSNVFDADYAAFGIVSENGRASPEETERFLTPGLPRRITVGVRAQVF
jgi:outer membrane receptor protein involved in Fe transport